MASRSQDKQNDDNLVISLRLNGKKDLDKQVIDILNKITKNKSEYIKQAILNFNNNPSDKEELMVKSLERINSSLEKREELMIDSLGKINSSFDVLFDKLSNLTITAISTSDVKEKVEEEELDEVDNILDFYNDSMVDFG